MSTIHLDGQITASGELLLELPKDLPSGKVHVTIEVSKPEALEAEEFTQEEVKNLLRFTPKTGGWQDMDITDPVTWVEVRKY